MFRCCIRNGVEAGWQQLQQEEAAVAASKKRQQSQQAEAAVAAGRGTRLSVEDVREEVARQLKR